MDSLQILERVLAEYPKVHREEPEIREPTRLNEDTLNRYKRYRLLSMENDVCHGILPVFARELFSLLGPGMKTLETGSGVSTLVFALAQTCHTAVTPEAGEALALQQYANRAGIPMSRVTFASVPSEQFLPTYNLNELDVVLLDGKHAFPWPAIDWFYCADRLKDGGLMILDDIQLNSVRLVTDFMDADPHWRFESNPGGRTAIYRKLTGPVHDVAWHMQPWVCEIRPPAHVRAILALRRLASRAVRATPLSRLLRTLQ
jgi:predicted O-methyltransferase YrrM